MKLWQFLLLAILCLAIQYLLPQVWRPLLYIDFFLVFVFHASRAVSSTKSVWQGFLAGLLQDLALSGLYPLGLQAIAKMTVGLLANFAGRHLNMDHPGVQTLFVFGFACLNNGLVYFLFTIFGQTCPMQSFLAMLFGAACTALINFPIWIISSPPVQDGAR